MPAVKTSLLLFYVRLFPDRRMRMVAYTVGAIEWCFCIASTIVDIDMCTPVKYFWDKSVGGHCVNTGVFYIVGSTMQLVTDVVVLFIPLPVVWSLHIGTSRKIGLSIIFLLGSVYDSPTFHKPDIDYWLSVGFSSVCVASTMRIVLTGHFLPSDITGGSPFVNFYSRS